MGSTRAHFTRRVKEVFGTTPSKKMAAIRKQKLEEFLMGDLAFSAENLAGEVRINSGKSLCSYLRRHFELTLTTMRKKALHAK